MSAKKPQINVAVPIDIDAVISDRAELLDLTKSKFCALVLEHWKKAGFPPVSLADEALANSPAAKSVTPRKARAS